MDLNDFVRQELERTPDSTLSDSRQSLLTQRAQVAATLLVGEGLLAIAEALRQLKDEED